MIQNFEQLLDAASAIQGKRVLVIFPNNDETYSAIFDAMKIRLAHFILVGDEKIIYKKIIEAQFRIEQFEILHAATIPEALKLSIAMIAERKADILMKGGVDTSTMMKAVLRDDAGVRSQRLLSDIFVL